MITVADAFRSLDIEQRQQGCLASFLKDRVHPKRGHLSPADHHTLSAITNNLFHSPVGTLGAVEQVHLLLLLRSGSAHVALVGVRLGVDDAGGLAESRDADAMPETDLLGVLGLSDHDKVGYCIQRTKKVLAAVIRT